ncbi:MAG: AMP-binding protein [Syntrophales bacterium]
MPLTTIFTDEIIERYTREGFWGRGTFLDHFEKHASRLATRDYITDAKGTVTFSEMSKIVDNIALRLIDLGFKKEDRIAVMLPNWVEFFYMHYAIEKIGAVIVPMFINLGERDVEYIVTTTKSVALIIPDYFNKVDYLRLAANLKKTATSLTHVFVIGETVPKGMFSFEELRSATPKSRLDDAGFQERRAKDTDVYSLRITSGTTARPKVYMYTENGYVNAAYILAERLQLTEKDVMLGIPPITQGIGLWLGFALPTIIGCRVILQERFEPLKTLRLIEEEQVTVVAVVPTQTIKVLSMPEIEKTDVSSLRVIQHAGALLPYSIAREAEEKFGCPVLNCFEASDGPDVCCTSLNDPDEIRWGTVGKPFPGHEVKIVGIDGKVLGPGDVGEIWSRGPSTSGGYYKEPPEVIRETFLADGWFRHGDLATIREDGNITIVGRIKDLIIRGGQNIAPKEIEDLLLSHSKIKEVAVIGIPDEVLGEKACAFVVSTDKDMPLLFEEMVDYLQHTGLAKFKWPERLEIIDELPVVGADKIDKKTLLVWATEGGRSRQ